MGVPSGRRPPRRWGSWLHRLPEDPLCAPHLGIGHPLAGHRWDVDVNSLQLLEARFQARSLCRPCRSACRRCRRGPPAYQAQPITRPRPRARPSGWRRRSGGCPPHSSASCRPRCGSRAVRASVSGCQPAGPACESLLHRVRGQLARLVADDPDQRLVDDHLVVHHLESRIALELRGHQPAPRRSSARPDRPPRCAPSQARAAYSGKPRARREDSGHVLVGIAGVRRIRQVGSADPHRAHGGDRHP